MNRLFFTLVLLLGLISPLFGLDFGVKPLDPESQTKLDALVEKLGDPSSKKREKTIGEILAFGDGAIETLQKAQFHPDFSVSEGAKYCLSMMIHGMSRSNDSPKVQTLLNSYDSIHPIQKMVLIMELSQLPMEESLTPLMRIVMHEKNPTIGRFSAMAVLWNLPYTQSVPQFFVPVPEPKTFPNPEEWSKRNEVNLKKRQETLEELRVYLASEPTKTEGKRFLERILQLEKMAKAENVDLELFEEMFQSLHDKINVEDPVDLTFLHEFLYFSADLLVQYGHKNEAKDFFFSLMAVGLTSFGNAIFQIQTERSLTLYYRVSLIERLVIRGLWEFVPEEISFLNKEISDSEKNIFFPVFISTLSTIGEFRLAREYSKSAYNLISLKFSSDQSQKDKEKISRLNQQISHFQALEACKKKDYAKAKEALAIILGEEDEPDVDVLILARKIAIFTNDSEWLEHLEKVIDEVLDKTEKNIQSESENDQKVTQLNTYAWLAANTERRLDEALKYAEEAVRLKPNSPGIQDTLATVYFARGNYEKALEIQTQAMEEGSMELELWANLERIRVYRDEKKSEKVETTP